MYKWLHRVWYEGASYYQMLLPLSGLYWLIITLRRCLYGLGIFGRHRAIVPVIIVGNITAGGTGKTPVTIWLAGELRKRGFTVGIVSRGYGGSKSSTSMRVDAASDPDVVGDEPVLLAKRTGCTVVVDSNRVRAAQMLVDAGADGVKVVIDGARGLGNRFLLPAGPLRETIDRLGEVDQVLINGRKGDNVAELTAIEQNAIEFELVAREITRLNGSLTRPIEGFSGTTVHAVAAIGNPARFFDMLRAHGIQVIEHAFQDHARLSASDLRFGDDFEVLMTEKDAVKLDATSSDKYWTVPVDLEIDPVLSSPWLEQIESRLRSELEHQ